jgi:hypothetical protein
MAIRSSRRLRPSRDGQAEQHTHDETVWKNRRRSVAYFVDASLPIGRSVFGPLRPHVNQKVQIEAVQRATVVEPQHHVAHLQSPIEGFSGAFDGHRDYFG